MLGQFHDILKFKRIERVSAEKYRVVRPMIKTRETYTKAVI